MSERQGLVCFTVNHSLVFSLWIVRGGGGGEEEGGLEEEEEEEEEEEAGGQVSLPCCPGTVRGRLGLIWALIPSPLPGDPRTNLM